MPRKPARPTRERILEASLRLFNQFGEPNVTTSAIGDEVGISSGNLYYHFRHKEEIVGALFEQFEREIDPLLDTPLRGPVHFEDAWLFLHLLFESIWRYRFVYRNLNDLVSRNRRLERHFHSVVERKRKAALALCEALIDSGRMRAHPMEVDALATNMVVLATYWLSFEYVGNADRFEQADYQSAAIARGAYHVLALVAPHLDPDGAELLRRLAAEYLART
ncbi:MAG: TetR/AcrR family transcriptional regulator [Burkholderiaceae bacterium]|nr:TetR/AcrR family transcriptional regulator [Burkholderiaceae bacterium]